MTLASRKNMPLPASIYVASKLTCDCLRNKKFIAFFSDVITRSSDRRTRMNDGWLTFCNFSRVQIDASGRVSISIIRTSVAMSLPFPFCEVKGQPLLARLSPVLLQIRVDDAGKTVELRPSHQRPPAIPRRQRIARQLLRRPAVGTGPPGRLAWCKIPPQLTPRRCSATRAGPIRKT